MHIIIGLIMFMFLVLVHEFGHFAIAKLSGIKVNEFSIGMGPQLAQFTKNETQYSIRLLPLGGYVAMEGEEEFSEDARSYKNAKPYQRFLTILAGPLMNLITAFLIFLTIFSFNPTASTKVESVEESLPAYEAGLKAGDEIVSVNGKKTPSFSHVSRGISEAEDQTVDLEVRRNGEIIKIDDIKAKEVNGAPVIGFKAALNKGFFANVKEAFYRVLFIMQLLWDTLGMLFSGKLGMNALSGPIGVIKEVGTAAKLGFSTLLMFLAVISINLGFFNLLPIPALDGSKLLFIIIEKIIGRPIDERIEEKITMVGFALLLTLIILVSAKDIWAIFKK